MEAEPHQCSGEIHVIVGPMFAGKATTLLRKVQSKRGDGSIRRNLKFTEIHVIVGPMFAGKTIMLLRKVQSERGDNRFDSPTYSVAFCSVEV
ncbi:unnamed protein product [Malus baccata var. baccata]